MENAIGYKQNSVWKCLKDEKMREVFINNVKTLRFELKYITA